VIELHVSTGAARRPISFDRSAPPAVSDFDAWRAALQNVYSDHLSGVLTTTLQPREKLIRQITNHGAYLIECEKALIPQRVQTVVPPLPPSNSFHP
jgi:hypothetical protein